MAVVEFDRTSRWGVQGVLETGFAGELHTWPRQVLMKRVCHVWLSLAKT